MTPAGPLAETIQGHRGNSESQWVSSNVPKIKKHACSNFIFFNNQRQENVTKDNSLGGLQLGLSFLSYNQCLQKTGTGEEGVEG